MNQKQINYFVIKFQMKMAGSVPSVAAWWVDGISELSASEKAEVFNQIQGSLDLLARDRGAEHEDLPLWVPGVFEDGISSLDEIHESISNEDDFDLSL